MGAQKVMRRLATQKRVVDRWRGLEQEIADLTELVSLAEEEEDTELAEDVVPIEVAGLDLGGGRVGAVDRADGFGMAARSRESSGAGEAL